MPATDHLVPFQRSARECWPLPVKAQTLLADVAAAATTISPLRPGNGTCDQADPLRSQAVGLDCPSNAHPLLRPTAVTAVISANDPPRNCLTIRHAGLLALPTASADDAASAETATVAAAVNATQLFFSMCPPTAGVRRSAPVADKEP